MRLQSYKKTSETQKETNKKLAHSLLFRLQR